MEKWDEITENFDVVASDGRQFHVEVWTTMMEALAFKAPNPPVIQDCKDA